MKRNIVFTAGAYEVWEIARSACKACATGWKNGTLLSPKDGGDKCIHGRGQWQAGRTGPRGGWRGEGPIYPSEYAAIILCQALATAASIGPDGNS